MTEIVRMTTQMQPLEVGVPLYPFSHAGVFSKETVPREATAAPLPDVTQYDTTADSPTSMAAMVGTMTASPPTTTSLSNWATPSVRSVPYAHNGHNGHGYPH